MPRRTTAATPALTALRRAGVAFEVLEFEVPGPEVSSGYGFHAAEELGADPREVFKTLMVRVPDGSLAAGVVPVAGTLNLKALAAVLGAKRVTMADPAVAERRTGYVVGGISPLGQRQRCPVVLDSSAYSLPTILVSGGRRGLDLRLAPADLVSAVGATVADIASD